MIQLILLLTVSGWQVGFRSLKVEFNLQAQFIRST